MNLYLHIPFCASRCSYCDFYKETKQDERLAFLRALETELSSRCSELPEGALVEHIYLGGGTPSQLSIPELERLFDTIWRHYPIAKGGEITIECNPDDVTPDYARGLAQLPTNRVSMGVQSFHEADLRFLSRRHSAEQVTAAVASLRSEGLTNLSLDLIYGLPRQTEELWEANIARFLELDVSHLSAYHLIYEEGTALTRLLQAGKVQAVDEEASLRFFELLIQRLKAAGYEHYEISNFARPGCYAQHNTGYWQGVPYLGFGPSAHSYDGERRRSYNVASLRDYIAGMERGARDYEEELLGAEELQHEYILTRMRTQWGIVYADYAERFGAQALEALRCAAAPYLAAGRLTDVGGVLRLTERGVFVSDGILADLFV
nr:radical SAM family heme chaperone HemW [uncultured Porphyromonas sp.]